MRIKKVTQTTPISGEIVDSLQGSSTDKAPSIRAVNEALETVTSENIYSTNETRIGTWIDGEPLYRIVCIFTNLTKKPCIKYVNTVLNVKDVVSMSILTTDGDTYAPVPWTNGQSDGTTATSYNAGITYHKNTNSFELELGPDFVTGFASDRMIIVMQYTKTTD